MKTIKSMVDHLIWADGRILDALEESETKNKDLLKEVGSPRRGRGTSLAFPIAGQGHHAVFVVGGSG
ncbi:hypothetical protein AB4114_06740 [Paenibacillus sp. 2RAB27]|uniref:hypothetical protein n=1 Tax=Paenibacillus sp. 2RAB27 TaxID=3232991 RepID=UPI003F971406